MQGEREAEGYESLVYCKLKQYAGTLCYSGSTHFLGKMPVGSTRYPSPALSHLFFSSTHFSSKQALLAHDVNLLASASNSADPIDVSNSEGVRLRRSKWWLDFKYLTACL